THVTRTLKLLAAVVAISTVALVGCGDDDPTTITVSAAASLRDAFAAIGDDFTAANPNVEVRFNFDSSSTLSTQIIEGAPADVYASADEANMAKLTDEGLIAGEPEVFARNGLVI